MRIFDLRTSQDDEDVKLSVSIDSERLGSTELWFSTPAKYGDCLCKTRMDGFLVGMLFPAMQYGEDIHVSGCLSERLLFNLNNFVVPLLLAFSPSSKPIKITADQTSSERFPGSGVGTGFSGGVDSFCTLYDQFELERRPERRINSLLFLNVGSHGPGEQEEALNGARSKFLARYQYLKQFTDEIGLGFIRLDSNLHSFHPWGHLKTDTLTHAAGVLIVQGHFNRYYYASSGFSYNDQIKMGWRFPEVSVADFCDPIISPLLATESLDFVLHGMQYSRSEKTLRVIDYEPVYRYLNVCVSGLELGAKNCSVCVKCCRTIMTLNSIGKLDGFSHIFDVEKYRRRAERRYVCEQMLLRNKDPFARDNVALAERRGIKLPSPVVCEAYRLRGFVVRVLKAVLPRSTIERIKLMMQQSGV